MKITDGYTYFGGGVGGQGSEKVYVLYTHLNVDNYGQPLATSGYVTFQRATDIGQVASYDGVVGEEEEIVDRLQ